MGSECEEQRFSKITKSKIQLILNTLRSNGAEVTGSNPWQVDTNKHGVILQGNWDEEKASLLVTVLDKSFFVPCSKIWDAIVPLIVNIANMEDPPVA